MSERHTLLTQEQGFVAEEAQVLGTPQPYDLPQHLAFGLGRLLHYFFFFFFPFPALA